MKGPNTNHTITISTNMVINCAGTAHNTDHCSLKITKSTNQHSRRSDIVME